ncbi:pituitary tumor-transforming gene 1 protein-interacting protein isoform X1 [Camelus dromedarius]|uniref:pituitary tumor-transforming gene 1 protein-interacting protein isoform X1 n=1 Tax=Camelus dromedarius TaxID=9838 RepID=UPI0031192779
MSSARACFSFEISLIECRQGSHVCLRAQRVVGGARQEEPKGPGREPGSAQDHVEVAAEWGVQTSRLFSACSQNTNRTCEECLKNVSCLWCNTNKACLDYPVAKILPPGSLCQLSSARWGVCWVNFEALIITMSVIGGTILLGVAVCCCCCCCRRKRSRGPDKSEEKAMREREERRVRQEERRAEMKSRHDEIRRKYGLFKEENPYARFENN